MRALAVTLLLVLTPVSAVAAPPVGYGMWSPAQIREVGARLQKEIGDKPIAIETLGTYKGHSVYLALRTKTGAAEIHETESDIQIGVTGTATLVVGGELIEPRQLPRKQQQGSGIKGGTRYPVGPGDIEHVPAATPHLLIIEPGKPYLYLLIKLDEEPK
jgi:hypothetical protein